ncbi:ABC transporter permease [Clostridium hydrogenum]|uniref:ABC transporter permease n=1 Tax=Clostridium hydrogenum TaxID=2855764 RepID=UPI001F2372EE|nr:ABC transporter permease [Clostridium hydrogenum]
MKVRATIILALKGFIVNWKQVVLAYVLFPLLMAGAMGYFQRDSFEAGAQIDKINISIVDNDNSVSSREFKELFKVKGIKELFNVSNKGDYIIKIPKGYETKLHELKNVTIEVYEKKRVSSDDETIIKKVINEYGKSTGEALAISNKVRKLNNSEIKIMYNNISNKINSTKALKDNMLKSKRNLTSYENQAATLITYMLAMMLMSCSGAHALDKESGRFRRLISCPITKETFFKLDLVCFFVSSLGFGAIYILTFLISDFAFRGVNPINLILILICQSILITSFSGLTIAFLGKEASKLVGIALLYFQMLFGGAFMPIKEVTNSTYIELCKIAPGNIVSEAYKNSIIFNTLSSISKDLIIMVIISIFMYAISIAKVRIRWEEV